MPCTGPGVLVMHGDSLLWHVPWQETVYTVELLEAWLRCMYLPRAVLPVQHSLQWTLCSNDMATGNGSMET